MPSNSVAHVAEVGDRHADLADLAAGQHVVAVVAGLGRQVEGDREAGLALGEVGAVELVRWRPRSSGRRRCGRARACRGRARSSASPGAARQRCHCAIARLTCAAIAAASSSSCSAIKLARRRNSVRNMLRSIRRRAEPARQSRNPLRVAASHAARRLPQRTKRLRGSRDECHGLPTATIRLRAISRVAARREERSAWRRWKRHGRRQPGITMTPPHKDLYEIGEIPPLGHVPAKMYAWAIRRERHGEPDTAMQVEVVDTPDARQQRGAGPRDGGGRQLQRRLGRRSASRSRRSTSTSSPTTSPARTPRASSGRSAPR